MRSVLVLNLLCLAVMPVTLSAAPAADRPSLSRPHPTSIPILAVDLSKDRVGKYDFAGNQADTSGYYNTGTVHGATYVTDRLGRANHALHFDGFNYYFDVPLVNGLSPSEFTVSLWIFPERLVGGPGNCGNNALFSVGSGNTVYYLTVYRCGSSYAPGHIGFVQTNSDGSNWSGVSTRTFNIMINTYRHVAMTYKAGGVAGSPAHVQIYVNGKLESEDANVPPSIVKGKRFWLSQTGEGPFIGLAPRFAGKMEQVRIYRRALSPREIQALYQEH